MKTFQILAIIFSSLIFAAFIIKCGIFLWNRFFHIKNNYKNVINNRLAAYQLLNSGLSIAAITLKYSGQAFHGCFLSAGDYFQFKNLLSDAEKEIYWYTKNTAVCLKEYIGLIDSKAIGFGLTMYSNDLLYQEFGIKYYEIFENYQNKLLESILSDYKTMEDVRAFLASKNDNNGEYPKVFKVMI